MGQTCDVKFRAFGKSSAHALQVMTCAVSSGEDVVLKKMLYLYITTYAQHNPDLTLLTINLLTKDCKDQDPTIRGLALRSLCQLRVANLIEYIVGVPLLRLAMICSSHPWQSENSGSRGCQAVLDFQEYWKACAVDAVLQAAS